MPQTIFPVLRPCPLVLDFPQKSNGMSKPYNGEGTSLIVNKPHIAEAEENTEQDAKLLNQSVHDQLSTIIDIVDHSGENEAVNSNDSCRITSSVISLTDESNCRLSESSQRHIKEHHSSMGSELVGASIDQNPKIGSCSDSNSEVENLSSTAKYNIFNCHTSFSELLEMVSSAKFHEFYSQRSKSTENLGDSESLKKSNFTQSSLEESTIPSHEHSLNLTQVDPQESFSGQTYSR
ncbi:hypothetical protein SESBI_15049 [Sesbania bispinosa]|nr:hypothetical protein SESBI_15049 [Sesbania bispinosa]